VIVGTSFAQYPYRLLRRRTASYEFYCVKFIKRIKSISIVRRAKARPRWGTIYMILAKAVARNSSWREVSVSPWCRSTGSAYSELEHLPSKELTRSAAVNLSFRTTTSAVIMCTWLIPKQGGRSIAGLLCAPRPANIISLDLVQFNFRLLSSAQVWTCVSSRPRMDELTYPVAVCQTISAYVGILSKWMGTLETATVDLEHGWSLLPVPVVYGLPYQLWSLSGQTVRAYAGIHPKDWARRVFQRRLRSSKVTWCLSY